MISSVCSRVFKSVCTDVTECRQRLVGGGDRSKHVVAPSTPGQPSLPLGANSLLAPASAASMLTFTDVQRRQVGTCGATGAAVNVLHLTMSRATFATMNVQQLPCECAPPLR